MGEKIPHSFLSVADVIQTKRQELRDNGRMPILHKSEYEALVLDTIKNDDLDIEDINDLTEVTQFMHERGRHELADWPKPARRARYLDVCYLATRGFAIMLWFKYMNVRLSRAVCFLLWRALQP